MNFVSLFAGIGGFDLGFERAKMTCVGQVELNPFCLKVLKKHWPDVKRVEDIRNVNGKEFGKVDVICGGFPCFVEGTQILTDSGYKNISDVSVGEKVLTKEGRFRAVNATMERTTQKLMSIKAQGMSKPLETTEEHPFWVKRRIKNKNGMGNHKNAEWVYAKDLKVGDLVSYRCFQGDDNSFTTDFWYMVGRYLGDGWILDGKRKSKIPQGKRGSRVNSRNWKVAICCKNSKTEIDELSRAIADAGFHTTFVKEKTVAKLIFSSVKLVKFLYDFGRYSYGKKLSGQCFRLTDERKKALFQGWLDSDGYVEKNGSFKVTTVSSDLAMGMAQIARDVYKCPVSISKKTANRICRIEGRVVNERPHYCVTVSNNPRYGYYKDGFVWCLVKKTGIVKKTTKVYNLGVSEDESYTADGVVCHNCQPFSSAGKRKGTGDDRYLWPEMLRVIGLYKPSWVVGENVRGLLSIDEGKVFEKVCLDLEGLGYEVQPFIIPACAKNAPHRRDRVWIIAHLASDPGGTVAADFSAAGQEYDTGWDRNWIEVATKLCRTEGVPTTDRASRLKALGNAVVPQIVEEIGRAIMDTEKSKGVEK